jgi:hypothetical protein
MPSFIATLSLKFRGIEEYDNLTLETDPSVNRCFFSGRFQVPSATGVNDIPALAFEPTAAFRCKPEAGSETRGFFEVDYSSAMHLRSGRLA